MPILYAELDVDLCFDVKYLKACGKAHGAPNTGQYFRELHSVVLGDPVEVDPDKMDWDRRDKQFDNTILFWWRLWRPAERMVKVLGGGEGSLVRELKGISAVCGQSHRNKVKENQH